MCSLPEIPNSLHSAFDLAAPPAIPAHPRGRVKALGPTPDLSPGLAWGTPTPHCKLALLPAYLTNGHSHALQSVVSFSQIDEFLASPRRPQQFEGSARPHLQGKAIPDTPSSRDTCSAPSGATGHTDFTLSCAPTRPYRVPDRHTKPLSGQQGDQPVPGQSVP